MAKVTFLQGTAILQNIVQLFGTKGSADVAVAYWGSGASESARIVDRPGRTRVLCDLFSGACNPEEISLLMESDVNVRTLDGMHAKVWCLGDTVIVGSANASANGLGLENAGQIINTEAAVKIQDAELAASVSQWFQHIWEVAHPITRTEIEEVRSLWEERKRNTHRQHSRTIGNILLSDQAKSLPERIRVLVYNGGNPSSEAEEAFSSGGRHTYASDFLARYPMPYYEDCTDWKVKPGDIIFDFHRRGRRKTLVFNGIWKVRRKSGFLLVPKKGFPNNRVILCDLLLDVAGYRFPKDEETHLAEVVQRRIDAAGWIQDAHGSYLDEKLSTLWT